MDRLLQARQDIDRIDTELARLFEARMAAAAEIAVWKQAHGRPIRDKARERELLIRNSARIQDTALRPHYCAFLKDLMSRSRDYQEEILRPEGPTLLWVRTASGNYPVCLRRGILAQVGRLADLERVVFLVTDEGVPRTYAETVAAQCGRAVIHTVRQGEAGKSPAVLTALLESMLRAGLTRNDCVAAVGGGMVCDLAGLAASLYMRGIDFFSFPTTLLAMVDASVGGKTAVNLGGVKNAVGIFRQPRAVIIDTEVLATLSPRHVANGLAEAAKMVLTHDAALFARFEEPKGYGPVEDIIAACLQIKRAVVAADEQDQGLRRVLNFGHTLGHGIEAASGGALLHGECIALGMLPMCAPAVRNRLVPVLERMGLPTFGSFVFDPDAAMAAICHDKKAVDGGVEIVTVPEIGRFTFRRASLEELRQMLLTLIKKT